MAGYLNDTYPAGAHIRAIFDTYNVTTGASITATNLVAADVEIYKDGSTTQRASDNGYTVVVDFDANTGAHQVMIDLSDNTDAGFYAVGSQYNVVVGPFEVDGDVINKWLGTFRITTAETTAGSVPATIAVGALANSSITALAVADGALDAASFASGALDAVWSTASRVLTAGTNIQLPSNGLANITAWTVALTGNITGSLSGAVGSVTGNIAGNVSGTVASVVGNVGGNVTGSVGSVAADGITSTSLAASAASEIAAAVLTTQMTESYAANGVAPTLAQAQFAIHQMLMSFAISGTTYTVRQLNGSTTAFLVTLNSATSPTSAARS